MNFHLYQTTCKKKFILCAYFPISNTLYTLPRYIRDLSQELNKQVTLDILGGEVKMDKMVLESLKDPIIHLLRNALDHGIESTEERPK